MTITTPSAQLAQSAPPVPFPILQVLRPREYSRLIGVFGMVALAGATASRTVFGWKLWQAVALFLVVMSVPAAIKWRSDFRKFGTTAAVAGILLTVQGLHTVEHITQWTQRHIMHLPLRESNGLLSPANSEWVHFVWNWSVLIPIVFLMFKGMRGFWGWMLLAWALGHTFEHTYMMVRYIQISHELHALGFNHLTAQGQPGIIGRGGLLDLSTNPHAKIICGFPGLHSADRVDVHFAWNMGEVLLALPAVHLLLRNRVDAFRA